MPSAAEVWASGDAYESYVGRWSRPVAEAFLAWLVVPPGQRWLDIGCGTGALTQTILRVAHPRAVTGIDPSVGYVAYARERTSDPRTSFLVSDAEFLPDPDGVYDVAVSGLVLNFVPRPTHLLGEQVRVTRPGGTVAAYVWDYAAKMELMRHFWDAAVALDPAAHELDEGYRFPLCRPESLSTLFEQAGLGQVAVRAIDVPTHFRDFDDYWRPFLGGQGPAPGYAMALDEERRAALREHLRVRLPIEADGTIRLMARAWAVRGTREPPDGERWSAARPSRLRGINVPPSPAIRAHSRRVLPPLPTLGENGWGSEEEISPRGRGLATPQPRPRGQPARALGRGDNPP